MSTEILLPKLGLTMDEAKVVTWLKNIGDYVEHEEVIVEVETDKANLEVESPKEGYLVKQVAAPGDVVAVGGGTRYTSGYKRSSSRRCYKPEKS